MRGSRGAGGLLALAAEPGPGGRRAGGWQPPPHRTAPRKGGGGRAERPRDPPASQAQAAGEIRTARSRTHAKQRRHKCGFGAVRACVNCPLLPQRLRCGQETTTRTEKQPLPAVPRPRRASPPASLCSARALAFLTASACRPCPVLYPSPLHSVTRTSRSRRSSATTLQYCCALAVALALPLAPQHATAAAGSSPRSHCDLRPSARVPGVVRVLRDPGSAARWPGAEAAVPRRSTTTSRRTPSRTSSLGSPTASPALPRGVSLPVPSRRFLLLLGSAQLTCRRSSTQL